MSRLALGLDGFDRRSVWGYDGPGRTYFALLWRNEGDARGSPDFSLDWFTARKEICEPLTLAELIADRTGRRPAEVLRAMAAACGGLEAAMLIKLADQLEAPGS